MNTYVVPITEDDITELARKALMSQISAAAAVLTKGQNGRFEETISILLQMIGEDE